MYNAGSSSGTMNLISSSSSSAGSTDLNRQLMFRKQNNIRVKNEQNLPKHLKNLKLQQQQQQQQNYQHFDINNNSTMTIFSEPTTEHFNGETAIQSQQPQSQIRKSLIKIKSTTLKNESVRVQANEIPSTASTTETTHFDSTVNSAHSAATINPDSDETNQRMMLVNLIHATMDAT